MVPDCQRRIRRAYDDLKALMASSPSFSCVKMIECVIFSRVRIGVALRTVSSSRQHSRFLMKIKRLMNHRSI